MYAEHRPIPFADLDGVANLKPSQVVAELADTLGPGVTAMIGDVKETRLVRRWREGQTPNRG